MSPHNDGISKKYSADGAKKLKGLIDKILSKFRFEKFKIERKGLHIRIYGEVNPWVLLFDGTIEKINRKNTHAGDRIEHEGKRGVVITRNTKPTAKVNDLNALKQGERKAIYENALKNGGKVEVGKYSAFGKMSEADGKRYRDWNYDKIHEISIHNPNSDSMTLGKCFDGTIKSGSYVAKVEATGDTYFSLGTQWDSIKESHRLTDKDMFELFNKPALDCAIA